MACAVDGTPEALLALRAGTLLATVDQSTRMLGQAGIDMAIRVASGPAGGSDGADRDTADHCGNHA